MLIYLVRHGIAEAQTKSSTPDSQRALTEEGCEKMSAEAIGLKNLGVEPEVILTSPLKRAFQTAEILKKKLKGSPRIEKSETLSPSGNSEEITKLLAGRKEDEIALVGHEPDMSRLASYMVCKSGDVNLLFKKGGVACILFESPPAKAEGQLQWLMTPKSLRIVGGKEES